MAICSLDFKTLQEFKDSEIDYTALIEIPRAIKDVKVAIILKEGLQNKWSISVRSDNTFDAAQLCRQFSGGGHTQAAGGRLDNATHDEVVKRLLEEIKLWILVFWVVGFLFVSINSSLENGSWKKILSTLWQLWSNETRLMDSWTSTSKDSIRAIDFDLQCDLSWSSWFIGIHLPRGTTWRLRTWDQRLSWHRDIHNCETV